MHVTHRLRGSRTRQVWCTARTAAGPTRPHPRHEVRLGNLGASHLDEIRDAVVERPLRLRRVYDAALQHHRKPAAAAARIDLHSSTLNPGAVWPSGR